MTDYTVFLPQIYGGGMNDYTLGGDVSKFQDNNATTARPDFKKAKAAGWEFVIIRLAGAGIVDEDADYNWKAAADAGLLRAGYSFIDYRYATGKTMVQVDDTFKAHAETAIGVMTRANDYGELGMWGDWERPTGEWPVLPPRDTSLRALRAWYAVTDAATNRVSGFYGNVPSIQNLTPVPDDILSRPLWKATWPSYLGVLEDWIMQTSYVLPSTPWPKWTFWQFSSKGDGLKYGMESGYVDMDVFNGSLADLRAFATLPVVEPPAVDPHIAQLAAARQEMEELIINLTAARDTVNREVETALSNFNDALTWQLIEIGKIRDEKLQG